MYRKMEKIAIYCVNYKSYDYLATFLESVDKAAKAAAGLAEVSVFVADNTDSKIEDICINMDSAMLRVFAYHANYGYFGAVSKMMEGTDPYVFDFIIISNVDVRISNDALILLVKKYGNGRKDVGWIAPQIYSEIEKRDRNPQILKRYSLRRLRLLRFMFKHPFICMLYKKTAYKRKSLRTYDSCYIYGGHGSFIILTNVYLKKCGIINYPIFLYCEEIYLAEQCYNNGLKVIYDPEVMVWDMEHASTGKMPSSLYFKYNKEALEYVMKTFY